MRKLPYGLFLTWLTVVFLAGLALRFHANLAPSTGEEPSLLLPERLALVSKFSPDLSPETRAQLLDTALVLESDADRKAVMEGRAPQSVESLDGDLRLLAQHDQSANAQASDKLKVAAAQARTRLLTCLGLLSLLLGCALGWSFLSHREPEQRPQAMAKVAPSRTLALFFGWDVLNLFVVGTLTALLASRLPPMAGLLLGQLVGYGLLLAMLKRIRPVSWNLGRRFSLAWVGRGYFGCYLLVFATNSLLGLLLGTEPVSKNPLVGLFLEGSGWQVATLAVLVVMVGPFFEELLFRGWIFGGLRGPWGTKAALVASAALFAIIHADPWATPALFVLGLVFGAVYHKTGSLWASVILHAMWNATTFTYLLANMP